MTGRNTGTLVTIDQHVEPDDDRNAPAERRRTRVTMTGRTIVAGRGKRTTKRAVTDRHGQRQTQNRIAGRQGVESGTALGTAVVQHGAVGASAVRKHERAARARFAIADEFGLLTSSQVARFSGATAKNAAATAHRWRHQQKVFAVRTGSPGDFFPGFQFRDGLPAPVIGRVLRVFADRLDGWAVAFWFASNNGWLDGRRPVDLIGVDDAAIERAARYAVAEPE